MRTLIQVCGCTAILLTSSVFADAQVLKNIGNRAKQKAEQRANQKVDQAIDKGLDKTEEAATKKGDDPNTGSSGGVSGSGGNNQNNTNSNTTTGPASFKTYAKFDFIPGEKVIAIEDFSNVAPGDFPDKWNTNSTGDIQTIEGRTGKWMSIQKPGVFMPEFITSLPENFTLEFELYCNREHS